MNRTPWDRAAVAQAIGILKKSADYPSALSAIAVAMKRHVSHDSLKGAFARHNKPTPFSYVPGAEIDVDPVERREKQDASQRLKREHADLVSQLREMRARQSFIDRLATVRPPPKILRHEKSSGLREMAAVVLASDWHVEEPVDPESVAGVNAYNMEIAKRRIKRFFDAIIWEVRHHRASGLLLIRQLVLWLGGDLITGFIHPECVENNEVSPTVAILWLLPLLRDGILMLLRELELDQIVIPCSYGNHGRTTEKRRIVTGYANSFEWLLYCQLQMMFEGEKRVVFEITASAHQFVDVFTDKNGGGGFRLHFTHGDEFRYNGGIGGLGVPFLKRVAAWNQGPQRAHVHNIGHYHQKLDFGVGVVNGSLIGYNAFAQSIGASPEPAKQALYLVDSRRGKCQPGELWVDELDAQASKRAA